MRVKAESEIETRYDFNWDGRLNHCHTRFYRATLAQAFSPPIRVQDAAYNRGVVWLPVLEIRDKLNYHPVILNTILALTSDNAGARR